MVLITCLKGENTWEASCFILIFRSLSVANAITIKVHWSVLCFPFAVEKKKKKRNLLKAGCLKEFGLASKDKANERSWGIFKLNYALQMDELN